MEEADYHDPVAASVLSSPSNNPGADDTLNAQDCAVFIIKQLSCILLDRFWQVVHNNAHERDIDGYGSRWSRGMPFGHDCFLKWTPRLERGQGRVIGATLALQVLQETHIEEVIGLVEGSGMAEIEAACATQTRPCRPTV